MEWPSKCQASGQQRITDVCEIVCTALVSQLWGHNNKVGHSIQHKPPAGQPNIAKHPESQKYADPRIEVSEAVTSLLQRMWPLFPGCDWILTFQQVTKYHILEILPQNVKLTRNLYTSFLFSKFTKLLLSFLLCHGSTYQDPLMTCCLFKLLAIFSFCSNANFNFSLSEHLE